MDKATVFGTVDGGSSPSGGKNKINQTIMKKIFWFVFLGLLLTPLLSLAKESYSICVYQNSNSTNYVGSYGKCCPEHFPLNCDNISCCKDITLDDDGHCIGAHLCSGVNPPIDPVEISYDGLVPCGRCLEAPSGVSQTDSDKEKCGDGTGLVYVPCQLCHFFIMAVGILNFIAKNVFYLAVFMIVLAGGMFVYGNVLSPGNPQLVNNATKIVSSTLIGLFVFFAAYLIINLFFDLAGVVDIGLGRSVHEWFKIKCLPHLSNPNLSVGLKPCDECWPPDRKNCSAGFCWQCLRDPADGCYKWTDQGACAGCTINPANGDCICH